MSGYDDEEAGEETGTFGPLFDNRGTMAALAPQDENLPAPPPRAAFLVAYDRLAELASAARKPAFAVGIVDARARLAGAVLCEAGSPLTIGRHTKCRLRVPSNAISLRHMAGLVLTEGGAPKLHVWDLNTKLPFRTEDGNENGSLASDGPTYLSIGSFALWFMPCSPAFSWPARAADAWSSMPPRTFVDRRAPASLEKRAGVDALPPPRLRGGPYRGLEEPSRVTTQASPLLLGDDEEPEIAWGTIRLQAGTAKAKRRVSAERLEQGLLIGRYERCGLSLGEIDRNVSRVHFLLVRIGADVWAIDTGSTNGIRRNGRSIEAEVLANVDRLEFGSRMILDWNRLEHAEA